VKGVKRGSKNSACGGREDGQSTSSLDSGELNSENDEEEEEESDEETDDSYEDENGDFTIHSTDGNSSPARGTRSKNKGPGKTKSNARQRKRTKVENNAGLDSLVKLVETLRGEVVGLKKKWFLFLLRILITIQQNYVQSQKNRNTMTEKKGIYQELSETRKKHK